MYANVYKNMTNSPGFIPFEYGLAATTFVFLVLLMASGELPSYSADSETSQPFSLQ